MRCIYCREPSASSTGVAHVFPEAILPKGPTLPLHAICDSCNHFFGAKLEAVLIRHPLIALPLQLYGLPGKEGKPRRKIGIFDRDAKPDASVTFPIEPPRIIYDENGVRTGAEIEVSPSLDRSFDMDRFRRALYHIGFNLLALNRGVESTGGKTGGRPNRKRRLPTDSEGNRPLHQAEAGGQVRTPADLPGQS